MIKSFAVIYKDFYKKQKEQSQEYEAVGMDKEQIQLMYEFDKEQFARDIAYMRRTQNLPDNNDEFESESQNPLGKIKHRAFRYMKQIFIDFSYLKMSYCNTVERCIESATKRLRYSIGYTPPLPISLIELKYQFNQ